MLTITFTFRAFLVVLGTVGLCLRGFSRISPTVRSVEVYGSVSDRRTLMFVLGPLLHSLYTSPSGDIARTHDINFHLNIYADNMQLYLLLSLSLPLMMDRSESKLMACVRDIAIWMLCNKLKMNEDKTEGILPAWTSASSIIYYNM